MFLPGFTKTASRESVFALIGWDTPVRASQAARLISFTPSFSRRRKRSRNVPQFRYRSEMQGRPNRRSHYRVFERALQIANTARSSESKCEPAIASCLYPKFLKK